jgi:hypothetical protein
MIPNAVGNIEIPIPWIILDTIREVKSDENPPIVMPKI